METTAKLSRSLIRYDFQVFDRMSLREVWLAIPMGRLESVKAAGKVTLKPNIYTFSRVTLYVFKLKEKRRNRVTWASCI
jgi:hypothetical protein